jgi:predicted nucleic acid-binding protein
MSSYAQSAGNMPETTFVLDASAILRFLARESGADKVFQIFRSKSLEECHIVASSIHWGEVASVLMRRSGAHDVRQILKELEIIGIEIIPVTGGRAVRAAEIQARLKLPYVDSFGIELAHDSPSHIFVTADFDFKPAANEVQIEFLPVK